MAAGRSEALHVILSSALVILLTSLITPDTHLNLPRLSESL